MGTAVAFGRRSRTGAGGASARLSTRSRRIDRRVLADPAEPHRGTIPGQGHHADDGAWLVGSDDATAADVDGHVARLGAAGILSIGGLPMGGIGEMPTGEMPMGEITATEKEGQW